MYRTNRSFAVLRAAVVAAPLLLAMGGCAVVPLAELASSEAGRAGMQSALHSFLPATAPDAATPCEAAATRPPAIGCDKVAARKDTQRRQDPPSSSETATGGAPAQPCAANDRDASTPGCATGGAGITANAGTMLQNLAGSLQRWVPGSLVSR